MKYNILVIDDDKDTLEIVKRVLNKKYNVFTRSSIKNIFSFIKFNNVHCIISDLIIPETTDLDFIKQLIKKFPSIPIIVISGKATVNMAVSAMKIGVSDFIEKPILDLNIIDIFVKKALESVKLKQDYKELQNKLLRQFERNKFIGQSPKIIEMLQVIKKVATLNSTVLIEGETGTGKELVAQMVHNNSNYSENKFVAVNCGAIPKELIESHIFGHIKGSFTGAISTKKGYFEEAENGTLFLDEISEIPLEIQVKLLRVLQEKTYRRIGDNKVRKCNVRIITASNKNLEEEVENNNFREDLFYRLNVIKIIVPPISERIDDIPLLVKHFMKQFIAENDLAIKKINKITLDYLKKLEWKGNVRQLKNVVEHAVALSDGENLTKDDFPEYLKHKKDESVYNFHKFKHKYAEAKEIFEKKYFENLLKECKGNISKASRIAGLSRTHLYSKLKEFKLISEN